MTERPTTDPTDDPRLTAYALGELPEKDRAEIEALLARDAAAREFVDATRAFAATLTKDLGGDVRVQPTPQPAPAGRLILTTRLRWVAAAAVAGGVAAAFTYRAEIGQLAPMQARDVARASPPTADNLRTDYTTEDEFEEQPLEPSRFREAGGGGGAAEPELTLGLGDTSGDGVADRYLNGGGGGGGGMPLRERVGGRTWNGAGPGAEDLTKVGYVSGEKPAPAKQPAPGGKRALIQKDGRDYIKSFDVMAGSGGGGGDPVSGYVRTLRDVDGDGDMDVEFVDGATVPATRVRPDSDAARRAQLRGSTESYAAVEDNPFRTVVDSPLSTFGADVDKASYANVRRFLNSGTLPPPGAVRIEEMVNYFPYRYDAPTGADPFAVHLEAAGCPWKPEHRLVRIGLKGRELHFAERPASNLVFLIDVSGSMEPANKLPLLVESMKLLAGSLDARDKVSIVVYAGAAGCVLAPTPGDQKETILAALGRLRAGGSTNGAGGIQLAYQIAQENFVPGGTNRVVLATDGDFNVGISDESSLVQLIEEKAKSKVFLSVLGFGDGNLQDAKMEKIADKGNGNYAYVDSLAEGKKVLVDQAAGTLCTIAKDVKLQVEFNPLRVAQYRLIGYENRVLATEDFANDRKDSGDVGAGHTVTALYEIVPTTTTASAATEPLRYQRSGTPSDAAHSEELLTVKLRWKLPEGDTSVLREVPMTDSGRAFDAASADFHFAASVASFGMLLRNSPHKGGASWDLVAELASSGRAYDPDGARAEFVQLVQRAKAIAGGR